MALYPIKVVQAELLVKQRCKKIRYSVMRAWSADIKTILLLQIALCRPIIHTPSLRQCIREGVGGYDICRLLGGDSTF